MHEFELDVYLRVELFSHKIFISSVLVYAAKQFSEVIVQCAASSFVLLIGSHEVQRRKMIEQRVLILKSDCDKEKKPDKSTFHSQGSDLFLTLI